MGESICCKDGNRASARVIDNVSDSVFSLIPKLYISLLNCKCDAKLLVCEELFSATCAKRLKKLIKYINRCFESLLRKNADKIIIYRRNKTFHNWQSIYIIVYSTLKHKRKSEIGEMFLAYTAFYFFRKRNFSSIKFYVFQIRELRIVKGY